MADIVLINPRFTASYWGLEHALPLMGKKANLPPAGLLRLAALTPGRQEVTIIDENVAPIDFDRCARADLVGLTGMIVQRHRMREILIAPEIARGRDRGRQTPGSVSRKTISALSPTMSLSARPKRPGPASLKTGKMSGPRNATNRPIAPT